MKHTLILVVCAIAALSSCKKEEAMQPDLGYGYFPRAVGAWIEYQVDSSWRDDGAGVQGSVSYRLKEKVVEQYTDPAGRTAWRIHRSVLDADSNWVVRDVWTSTVDENAAEVSEENHRRLKLSFPVRDGRRWDLNVYNVEDELEVAFREVGLPWSGGGLSHGATVLVKNTVPPNLVDTVIHEERYSQDIGLVHKRWVVSNSQWHYPPPPAPPQLRITGNYLTMVAVAHGTE